INQFTALLVISILVLFFLIFSIHQIDIMRYWLDQFFLIIMINTVYKWVCCIYFFLHLFDVFIRVRFDPIVYILIAYYALNDLVNLQQSNIFIKQILKLRVKIDVLQIERIWILNHLLEL